MPPAKNKSEGFSVPILQGVLPVSRTQIPAEIIAGMTLAALAVPEVMGYTKISGTPVVTGLYTILITGLMVVLVGVEQGIILAIVLSLIDHTRRGYRPKNVVLVPAESGVWHARPVATIAQALPGLIVYRFTHSMYYANCQRFSEEILYLVNCAEPPVRWLCLDASAVDDVDYSAAETLRSVYGILKEKGVRLIVAQVLEDVKAESRYHLSQLFGKDAFYDTLEDVVTTYRRLTGTQE